MQNSGTMLQLKLKMPRLYGQLKKQLKNIANNLNFDIKVNFSTLSVNMHSIISLSYHMHLVTILILLNHNSVHTNEFSINTYIHTYIIYKKYLNLTRNGMVSQIIFPDCAISIQQILHGSTLILSHTYYGDLILQ